MIEFICLFGPAFCYIFFRNKYLEKRNYGNCELGIIYAMAVVGLNLGCFFVLKFFGYSGSISKYFEKDNAAIKWLVCSLLIILIELIAEKGCSNVSVSILFNKGRDVAFDKFSTYFIEIYSVVLVCLNFIRVFDRNYSWDEEYSILMVNRNWSQIISETAVDVHPPLYYFILKFISHFLGHTGFVYHFVSFIAYVAVILFSIIIIRKLFGNVAATLFITLSSFLYRAVRYNVEIRMYSWAAFFVLGTFVLFYLILKRNRYQDYVLMGIFGLAAAYTHYYALISVSFFFIVMIFNAFFRKEKKCIIGTFISCSIAIIGYLYWLFVLIQTFLRTSNDWWMSFYPKYKDCFQSLFSGTNEKIYLYSFFLALAIVFIGEIGIVKVQWNDWKVEKICLNFRLKSLEVSPFVIWIISGVVAILGTMTVGIGVSYIFRPLFYVKYMYPVSVVAWLIFAVCVSKIHYKKLIGLVLLVCMVSGGIKDYSELFVKDKMQSNVLENTLTKMDSVINAGGEFLSTGDISHSVAVYYPEKELTIISDTNPDLAVIQPNKLYCFVGLEKMSEEMKSCFNEKGFNVKLLLEEGYFASNTVFVYRIQK